MSEHRASPSSLAEQAATDSDILCALVKQNKYNTAYNNYQCRNLGSVTIQANICSNFNTTLLQLLEQAIQIKYLQFNRETEQKRVRSRSARIHPADSSTAQDAARKAHAGQRQTTRRGAPGHPGNAEEHWFGHTTSSTPHLIPSTENLFRQPQSTALGHYAWGTGCAERFLFLAAPAFLPVAREGFQSAPAVSRSGEPSAGLRGPESEERSTIRPWQKAREE
ncbi:Hypothetical_protein [Hexamita inflata]|uniref:Hypothetical_protein n=1 Tax=Hexamita inflata TaxID=28002 RepID=A0AA86S5B3_9EUKA|nr:Hypothetical protein HINF_LOCUS65950 [Hexamita inflata]